MEHRFACRRALNIGVELRRDGIEVGSFRTRDIDANGVFIETPDTGLGIHEIVEVDFVIEHGDWRRFTRKGIVVRRAPDGLAVMFPTEDTDFYDALEELLSTISAARKTGSHG